MINKLFDLIKKNKYTDIKKIINDSSKKSVNFNFKFDNDNYFIEYVILSKNLNFIKFILDQDIALDILTSDGLLILHNVIKFFDDESMEYIVHDENSWFKVLKKLIIDCELRSSLGIKLYKIWQNNFRHEVLNKKLVKILDKILKS